MSYKDRVLLVWDLGLFVSLAESLSPDFGKTYYFSSYESAFARDADTAIGDGLPGVKRVHDPWKVIDGTDKENLLILFPDTFHGGLQEHLRRDGYRVWGAGRAEDLETDRLKTKRLFARLGIPIPEGPTDGDGNPVAIVGIRDLREALKAESDCYVKLRHARARATFESHHWVGMALSEEWLDEVEQKLGKRKFETEFILEMPVEPAVEISSERFLVDGKFPDVTSVSIEIKGDGLLSRVTPTKDVPSQITEVDRLILESGWGKQYRQMFTIETRVTEDGTPYPIDPCCRFGRPMIGTFCANVKNKADIFWLGAGGEMVNPEYNKKWSAELMIECPTASTRGCSVSYPETLQPYVSLSDVCIVEGKRFVVPMDLGNVGSVTGLGDTPEAAIAQAKKHAGLIKADAIEIHAGSMDKAMDQWKLAAKHKIDL